MTHDPLGEPPADRLADIQRARILDALAAVLAEHGLAGATVGAVCKRAKVSSRTFYAVFDSLERCLLDLLDKSYGQIRRQATQALRDARTVSSDPARPGDGHTEALVRAILAERRAAPPNKTPSDPPVDIPAVLRDPRAHRARGCLRYLAEKPGASNRQIADGIGIARHDQASTLLSRLSAAGLLAKQPGAPGLPNAWTLTQHGVQVALALNAQATLDPHGADTAEPPLIQEIEFSPASSTHAPGAAEFDIANSTHVPVTHRNAQAVLVKHLDRS